MASIQDFYKGYGATIDAGDSGKWDKEDFSKEQLYKFIESQPHMQGINNKHG